MKVKHLYVTSFFVVLAIISYGDVTECGDMPFPPRFVAAGITFGTLAMASGLIGPAAPLVAIGFVIAAILNKNFRAPDCQARLAAATASPASMQYLGNAPSGSNPTGPSNPPNDTGGTAAFYPAGPGLTLGRTDQGVDWGGKGPLYAVGSGTIKNLYNTGWPGGTFIVLQLDNAAGLPSPDVYYAENISPSVQVGQRVTKGQIIGYATGGGSGIELGWADPNAIGQALAHGQYKEGIPTQLGTDFLNWIKKALVAL